MLSGARNLERATSMRSCHGVCMDQCIFRTIFVQIFNSTNQSQPKPTDLKMIFFVFYKGLVFLVDTSNALATGYGLLVLCITF